MNFRLPTDLYSIHRIFRSAGFELYLVGGAIRSLVLGQEPKDWDLASNAEPKDIQALFRKVIPTGLKHGTVTIRFRSQSYEVTTFRVDGEYSDGRRPDSVSYTPSIEEDLKRRDFCINAMAYDIGTRRLIDPHNGRGDIAKGLIRTVGDPHRRFAEDALRMLRSIRFASVLGFSIEAQTFQAVRDLGGGLQSVSTERLRDEFSKILMSPVPSRGLRLAMEAGVLGYMCSVLVDVSPNQYFYLRCCDRLPALRFEARLASLLLAGIGAERSARAAQSAYAYCRGMRFPNKIAKKVHALVLHYAERIDAGSDASIRHFLSGVGTAHAGEVLLLRRAVAETAMETGQYMSEVRSMLGPLHQHNGNRNINRQEIQEIEEALTECEEAVARVLSTKPPLSIFDLNVNGRDLIEHAGVPQNAQMKRILRELLNIVLDEPEKNEREYLITTAKNLYNKYRQDADSAEASADSGAEKNRADADSAEALPQTSAKKGE